MTWIKIEKGGQTIWINLAQAIEIRRYGDRVTVVFARGEVEDVPSDQILNVLESKQ